MKEYVLKVSVNGLAGYLANATYEPDRLFTQDKRNARKGVAGVLAEELVNSRFGDGNNVLDYFDAEKIRIEFEEAER